MEDFIATTPLNGFPYILQTASEVDTSYSWVLSNEEAVKIFWRSYFTNLSVNVNVSIKHEGEYVFQINKSYTGSDMIESYFDDYDTPTEPYQRVGVDDEAPIYYAKSKDDYIYFKIYAPYYLNEEQCEIRIHGNYGCQIDAVEVLLLFGNEGTSPSYEEHLRHECQAITILGYEIPCTLSIRCPSEYEIEEMTGSVSIESGYLD